MKKLSIILMTLLLATTVVWGQDYSSKNPKAIKLYDKAQTALYQSNIDQALRLFGQALEADPDFVECHIMMGDLYYDAHKTAQAKEHYQAAARINPTFFTLVWKTLADIALKEGQLDEAVVDYETFIKLDVANKPRHAEAQMGIATARFRQEALAHPVAFNPVNLGAAVNSANDEYFPALTIDGQTLVFTRRFPRNANTTATTAEEEDLYQCLLRNDKWSAAQRIAPPLNSTDNEGTQCISQDGRILFFTACGRRDGAGRCDVYMCVNKGGTWGNPRNVGAPVNSGAWESQPSFSIDGKTLYFVSDRAGGYGGLDIWKAVFENGKWSSPENLGPTVNTAGNEMAPFIHYDDHTLYFASDGHIGMGGLDLFCARRNSAGEWYKVENLGYPINTDGDESGLIVAPDAQTAYFASDRAGGRGGLDIYSFEMPYKVRPMVTVCWKGTVTDAKSGAVVAADIQIIDVATGQVVANTGSDAKTGGYMVSIPEGHDYAVNASAKGYLFYSESEQRHFDDDRLLYWHTITRDIALMPIETGERIALRNVFFETGKYNLLPTSTAELDKVVELLQQNATLRVELGGHTDNVGNAADNQRLSEQRAKAVYDYLVAHGIEANRLTYKGYGETQPVADNSTPTGQAANRRTEMKVL
ncbi:MAG: OmpA family protein [Bacteroidales bacterium]|nr:OmpA family protein [Bacteroidales bacterium]